MVITYNISQKNSKQKWSFLLFGRTSRIAEYTHRIDTLYYLLSQLRGGRIRRLPIVLLLWYSCFAGKAVPPKRFGNFHRDLSTRVERRPCCRHRNCFYAQNLLRTNPLLIILMHGFKNNWKNRLHLWPTIR